MIDLKGRRVLVFGLGATGQAVIEAGLSFGAEVFAYDDKPDEHAASITVPLLNLEQAARGKFDLCVISPGIPPGNELAQTLTRRDIPLISEIELAYQIARAPIVAITGTNGKSTTTALAGKMIEASGRKTWVGGNLSAEGYDLPLITAALRAAKDDAIVAEVSSFQLERTFEFRPKVGALLNLTPDHQNRHKDMGEYAAAKMRIFACQGQDDFAVIGLDDPAASALGKTVRARKLWFSAQCEVDEGAFLRGDEMVLHLDGTEKVFARAGEMRLWAFFDYLNTLAAACVASAMGAPVDAIREAAISFAGLSHRMEDCGTIDGVKWLNNSMCTNPAAGTAAVQSAAKEYGVILIAGGAHKNCDFAEWAKGISGAVRWLLVIGRDAGLLEDAARRAGVSDILRFETLNDAMRRAREIAEPGDAVLMAPAMASFDQFTDFRDRGITFRDIVESFRTEAVG